jgi:hypothetical protein
MTLRSRARTTVLLVFTGSHVIAEEEGLNIAKMSPGASCMDFAVKAYFRRS